MSIVRAGAFREDHEYGVDKRCECYKCGQQFTRWQNRAKHEEDRICEVTYQCRCDVCARTFRDRFKMRRHKQLVHGRMAVDQDATSSSSAKANGDQEKTATEARVDPFVVRWKRKLGQS